MKFKLQEYALAAEVISGIAIIATLIFLVVETRENTNAIQAQTYQSLTAELNEGRRISISPDIAIISQKIRDSGLESLSELEWNKQMILKESKWGVYESAYYAQERGILGIDEWLRFESAICRNIIIDYLFWYPDKGGPAHATEVEGYNLASNVTPRFRQYVETACEL